MSFNFIVGFMFGVYVGTRYDLRPFVDKAEAVFKDAMTSIKKRDGKIISNHDDIVTKETQDGHSQWWVLKFLKPTGTL